MLFPLQVELGFEIVACAGWTSEMAADRRAKMTAWRDERPEQNVTINVAQATIEQNQRTLGDPDDPRVIHTDAYDEFVRAGMQPYDEL